MEKADIERLLEAAAAGDARAAIDLGDYVIKAESPEAIDQALYWYSEAVNNGSLLGVLKAMIVHKVKAMTAKAAYDWDAVQKHANAIIDLYDMIPQDADLPEAFMTGARKEYCNGIYYLAVVNYFTNNKAETMSLLNGLEAGEMPSPLAHVLMGCSYFSFVDKADDLSTAYTLLSLLEKSPERVVSEADDRTDQILLSQGFGYLSIILRLGQKDINRAYDVLKKGYELLSYEECKEILQKEISHYRPKLFGGLQYV